VGSVPGNFLEKIFEIGGINVEVGLRYASGEQAVYFDSLLAFFEKILKETKIMESALEKDDIRTFELTVHAVKSMLLTIGATELSDTAAGLEAAAKEGNIGFCQTTYPDLHDDLLFLYDDFTELFPLKSIENTKKEIGSKSLLMEKLEKTLVACADFDNESAMNILTELKIYDFGIETDTLIDEAFSALKDFNIDIAESNLKKIIMENL